MKISEYNAPVVENIKATIEEKRIKTSDYCNASLAINGDGSVELKADEIVINQEAR